jgi:competence protein ComEC
MGALGLGVLLLGLAIGVLPLSGLLKLGLLVALWLALLVGLRRRPRLLALLALLLPLLLARGLIGQPHPGAADPLHRIPAGAQQLAVVLTAQLLEDPRPDLSGQRCSALARLSGGRSELQFSPCPSLRQGWRLQLEGTLRQLKPAPHPLLSGVAERLQRREAWTALQVERWQLLERTPTPVADLRRRMAAALRQAGGEQVGGVLSALVLGSAVSPLPAEVREAFRAAGLSHALAASGFHLSVLLGAVLLVARPLPAPLRWALALGAMACFLLLAGAQPSVVRAVLMGALAFALQEAGRRSRPLAVLLLCLLVMLLLRPAWLLDVGFQLSAAATAGLILSARPLEQQLRRHAPAWAAGAVAVPVAASLWTIPLQLLHFGALPLYAVPANLLVAPLLTPLTLGAMLMAALALICPPLMTALGWLLVPLTQLLVWLVRHLAALPLAQCQIGRLSPWLALALAVALLPWMVPQLKRWRVWAALLLGGVAALQLQLLRADQLLLVEDGSRQWLLARHAGRAALISRRADGFSCRRAAQLAQGLGVQRFDWVLSLDPVPPEQPQCWASLTPTLLAGQNGSPALAVGQRLLSSGLAVEAVSDTSQALLLAAGRLRWGLLPDRQAWWSWRDQPGRSVDGLWLGFRPRPSEQAGLPPLPPERLWWPAAGSASGWRQA